MPAVPRYLAATARKKIPKTLDRALLNCKDTTFLYALVLLLKLRYSHR